MSGAAMALSSGLAKASDVAEAHQLSSGTIGTMAQSHPVLTVFIHVVITILVVGAIATVFSVLVNPQSSR